MSIGKNIPTHLDRSVIYLFIGALLLASTTLAFRYAHDVPCEEAFFTHSAKEYRVGEMIKFDDKTEGAQLWEWDFGDGSEVSTQKNPLHIFTDEGDYEVHLTVNGSCQKMETITIQEKVVLLDPTKFPVFELPETMVVGQKLAVRDETENASTWEWRFGETAGVNATTQIAEYVYEEPGLKTVSLIVNGDLKYIGKKKISVLPLPEAKERITPIAAERRDKRLDLRKAPTSSVFGKGPEEDTPNAVPYITPGNFENKIKMVANGKSSAQAFSAFFCDDANPLIVANGRNTTFLVFCEDIKGKKLNIKSLDLIRKTGSNCITTFNIEF